MRCGWSTLEQGVDGGLLEGIMILMSCSEGSEEFGSPFVFLEEFRGISKISLILP